MTGFGAELGSPYFPHTWSYWFIHGLQKIPHWPDASLLQRGLSMFLNAKFTLGLRGAVKKMKGFFLHWKLVACCMMLWPPLSTQEVGPGGTVVVLLTICQKHLEINSGDCLWKQRDQNCQCSLAPAEQHFLGPFLCTSWCLETASVLGTERGTPHLNCPLLTRVKDKLGLGILCSWSQWQLQRC